jgi:hypothetical protein
MQAWLTPHAVLMKWLGFYTDGETEVKVPIPLQPTRCAETFAPDLAGEVQTSEICQEWGSRDFHPGSEESGGKTQCERLGTAELRPGPFLTSLSYDSL